MNRTALVLGLLSLVFLASHTPLAQAAQPGTLTVLSSMDGATVILNGKEMGKVPLAKPIRLAPGTYEVKVTLRGYVPYAETVTINPGENRDLVAELVAAGAILKVEGVAGARVTVDGAQVGVVPYEGEVPPGSHRVVVEIEDGGPLIRTVEAVPGEETRLEYKPILVKEPVAPVVVKQSGSAWYKKWWVWTAAGAVLAGGATATALILAGGSGGPPSPDATVTYP
jgi:hypothetical protein